MGELCGHGCNHHLYLAGLLAAVLMDILKILSSYIIGRGWRNLYRSFLTSPAKEGVMGPRDGYIDATLRSKTTGHQFLVMSKLIIQGLVWFYFTSKSEASCCFFSGVRFTELSQQKRDMDPGIHCRFDMEVMCFFCF